MIVNDKIFSMNINQENLDETFELNRQIVENQKAFANLMNEIGNLSQEEKTKAMTDFLENPEKNCCFTKYGKRPIDASFC